MNILCLIHSLDGGGAERVMAGLASRLAGREHRVTLVTLGDGRHQKHAVAPEVDRIDLDVMADSSHALEAAMNLRRRVRAIAGSIRRVRPDVVLSFCDRTNILAVLAARRAGVPVVISERSDPASQHLGRVWEFLRRRTYPGADAVIAQTESAADHLKRNTGGDVHVIASAVDSPPPINCEAAARMPRILAIGRLESEKGFDRLIDAFARIAPAYPDWSVRILGDGSERLSLEQRIDSSGLSGRVELAGWVRPVWGELAEAGVFVLPSRYEGFPSALLEAMAAGVACVAVDCPSGPRSIVRPGVDGILVDAVDPATVIRGLADAIASLIDDASRRQELGENARSVIDRFGWDAMVDAYERILGNVRRSRGV